MITISATSTTQLLCIYQVLLISLCQKKFRSRNKWNAASVRVEIGGPPPKVALFRTNLAVPFPKILVSSPAFQYAKQWSQFRSKRKWIASIRLKILISSNNVVLFSLEHSTGCWLFFCKMESTHRESRGGTAINGLYRYVPLWRVWFSSRFL